METYQITAPPFDNEARKEWMRRNLKVKEFSRPIKQRPDTSYYVIPDIAVSMEWEEYLKLVEIAVCLERVLNISEFRSETKTKKTEFVLGRQIVWHIIRERYSHASLSNLGKKYGKDHATVLHGIRQVNNLLETDKFFRASFTRIKERLRDE